MPPFPHSLSDMLVRDDVSLLFRLSLQCLFLTLFIGFTFNINIQEITTATNIFIEYLPHAGHHISSFIYTTRFNSHNDPTHMACYPHVSQLIRWKSWGLPLNLMFFQV